MLLPARNRRNSALQLRARLCRAHDQRPRRSSILIAEGLRIRCAAALNPALTPALVPLIIEGHTLPHGLRLLPWYDEAAADAGTTKEDGALGCGRCRYGLP